MNTATANRTEQPTAELPQSRGEVAILQPPRLPYHDAIKGRFGIDRGGWKVLCEAIFPAAKTFDSIVLALTYCQARNLDVFKRPVHIVPMWSSAARDYVETIWPGIAELRTTAFRTKQYVGCDEAEFGPAITFTFTGKIEKWVNRQRTIVDDSVEVTYPEWCRITIYRELGGRVCKFVGPKVKWIESYASIGRSIIPNEMWQERPEGQLEKCAEAASLRRAFPEELGNELTAEEMHGRTFVDAPASVSTATTGSNGGPPDPDKEPNESRPPPTPPAAPAGPPNPDEGDDIPGFLDRRSEKLDEAQWLKDLDGALGGCEEFGELWQKQESVMKPMRSKLAPGTWTEAEVLVRRHIERLGAAATQEAKL